MSNRGDSQYLAEYCGWGWSGVVSRIESFIGTVFMRLSFSEVRPGQRRSGCRVFVTCLWGLAPLLLIGTGLLAQSGSAVAANFVIAGTVKSGNTQVPGATVTALNQSTGEKVVTWSDIDGSYAVQVSAAGRYTVSAEMAAFAPSTREVEVSDSPARTDLTVVLASRAQQAARSIQRQTMASGSRGFQSLAVLQGEAAAGSSINNPGDQVVPQGMPIPGIAPDAATESIAVSGNAPGAGLFGMNSDEMQQRMREAREQQGGGGLGGGQAGGPGGGGGGLFLGGGPGGGPGGGSGGGPMIFGGGRGRFDINRPHGSIYYTVGDSALNAAPYSLTGRPSIKPGYLQNRVGVSLGGPLNIPKIYKGGNKTFFFVNYNGYRGENPFDQFSTVPTLLERAGDFSQSTIRTQSSSTPVQLFDPFTHRPIPNNNVANDPNLKVSPIAQGLLKFIPLPNLPGDVQNFHFSTAATSNSDDLNIRLMHAFGSSTIGPRRRGPQNNLTFGLHYHSVRTDLTNAFPSVGGTTSVRSFDIPIGYIRSIGKLTNVARVDYNRSRTSTRNLYAFNQNIAGNLGIGGVSQDPFDWGLPNLSFKDFGSLTDTNPQLLRNQTITFTDNMIWNHGKHTWRWGGDFRRIQLNTEASNDARGTFVFTGNNTAQIINRSVLPNTGFDLADFLLGLPQQTLLQRTAQPGDNNYHFRGNSWDLFVQDEWKLRGNLTLNLGLRYEYVSPFTELNDRIANLILSPGVLTGVGSPTATPVLPGQGFPSTLIHADRNNFAPRVGLAWKAKSNIVVRAGYGINYNTGAYQTIAQQLAFQPPFSLTQTNVQSAIGDLTLQNGFPAPAKDVITNNYAVDPNYRLGYVQIWNLDVQQEIKPTLLLNLDYTGTKGTRLDIVDDPNRTATGILIPNVQPFNWETSQSDSVAHAGTVRLRKRLQRGISIGGSYTFSKSIDNASSIGGSAFVVAQNPRDLAAERGLSIFDQRHKFTADYLWELPFGRDRRWLTGSRALSAVFGDWNWSGDWTISSGLPFTPRILGNFSEVNRGTNGTLRPDVVLGESVSVSNPSLNQWFNTAAFVTPPPGQFGDARRNSIEGPGSLLFDMAFTKIVPLRESRALEIRAQMANVFNTPQYTSIDTTLNSLSFGRVIAVGAMRTIQFTARFRF
ncbi:MAG TPA: TonB-dependent receptor [Terriglobales bacterium]|nr:TonB-dependent receptor [Terriglobales bacterium]